MKNKWPFIFVGCVFVWAVFKTITSTIDNRKDSNEYFKKLNLVLTGIVTDKQVLYSDAGLLYVDVRSTTIPEYDVRSNTAYYYCIIHKNKAEIIEGGLDEIHAGDSIVVNSKIDSVECFRDNRLVVKKWLGISHFDRFYKDVKNLHRF